MDPGTSRLESNQDQEQVEVILFRAVAESIHHQIIAAHFPTLNRSLEHFGLEWPSTMLESTLTLERGGEDSIAPTFRTS